MLLIIFFTPEIREEFDTVIVSVFWYGYRAFRFPAFAGSPHNVAPSLPIKILPSNKGCPIECFSVPCIQCKHVLVLLLFTILFQKKKRRKDNRIILLYKGLKGRAKIPTDDLIPKNRRCRNQHSLAFQIPSASTNAYLHSFFPQTIRDWNELPDSLISSAELSDDCVSKFTSLVRARD